MPRSGKPGVEHDERGEQEQLVRAGDAARDARAKSTLSATRKIRTRTTSGTPIEMIVRGWRRRLAERDLPAGRSPPLPRGPRRPAGPASIRPAGQRVGRDRGGLVASASDTGGSLTSGHPRCRPGWMTRRLPRARLTSLATGVRVRTIYEARPGTKRDVGQGCQQPFGCRRVAVEGRVGDADLDDAVGVGHGDARAGPSRARTRPPARCPCRPRPGRCAPPPSRPAAPSPPAGGP